MLIFENQLNGAGTDNFVFLLNNGTLCGFILKYDSET